MSFFMKPSESVYLGYHHQIIKYIKENFECKDRFTSEYCRTYSDTRTISYLDVNTNMEEFVHTQIDDMLANIPNTKINADKRLWKKLHKNK